tara:strand:- start:1039 stop:1281 length:243 start_codon:yes stop_codon:yes gene_type:complete
MARFPLSLLLVALCLASVAVAFDSSDCFTREDNWWDFGALGKCGDRAACIPIGTTVEYQYEGDHNVFSTTRDTYKKCTDL